MARTKTAEPVELDLQPKEAETTEQAIAPIQEPPPPQPAAHWLSVIDKMIEKNVSAELLSKVFEMQVAWEKEQQRREFVTAFAAFKAEAPASIERTGKVGFESKGSRVGYEHVELDVACAALVPIMSKHGLAHSWETTQADGGLITVTCQVEHSAGHSKKVTLRGMPDTSGSKNAIQAVGSAVYYLERYTLMAALGMAQKGIDDDGKVGGDSFIDLNQVAEINEAIEDIRQSTPFDFERFKKWCKVEDIGQIKTADFNTVITELRRRQSEAIAINEAVQHWTKWFDDDPTIDQLNSVFVDAMKKMPEGAVKSAIKDIAGPRIRNGGLEWNAKAEKYVAKGK